jgi:hypothetical protein
MADIGRPEREIDVLPDEEPVPRPVVVPEPKPEPVPA